MSNELNIIRDISKLRAISPERFSKALSYMILDDYNSYTTIMNHLEKYDSASGAAKTSIGYLDIDSQITDDLRKSLIAFVEVDPNAE